MSQSIQQEAFRLNGAVSYSEAIDEWLAGEPLALYAIAREWFAVMRKCGDDVVELLHDGYPVACVGDVAFCYVNVFRTHVNVGFFMGSFLDDAQSLLEGTGKRMRHIKLKPDVPINRRALAALVQNAYSMAKIAQ